MSRHLFRVQRGPFFRRTAQDAGILFVALMLVGGSPAASHASAGRSAPEPASKPTRASLRDYLPALLQKTLLENERQYITALERLLKDYQSMQEISLAAQADVNQVERALLQARIRALQRERDYRDSLDQLQTRVETNPEQLRGWEESAILPFTRHLGRINDVFKDHAVIQEEVNKLGDPESAPQLRAELRHLGTATALVKGTQFRQDLPRRWASWEKLSAKELEQLLDCRRRGAASVHQETRPARQLLAGAGPSTY